MPKQFVTLHDVVLQMAQKDEPTIDQMIKVLGVSYNRFLHGFELMQKNGASIFEIAAAGAAIGFLYAQQAMKEDA